MLTTETLLLFHRSLSNLIENFYMQHFPYQEMLCCYALTALVLKKCIDLKLLFFFFPGKDTLQQNRKHTVLIFKLRTF